MIFSIRNLGFELGSLLLEGWAAFAARVVCAALLLVLGWLAKRLLSRRVFPALLRRSWRLAGTPILLRSFAVPVQRLTLAAFIYAAAASLPWAISGVSKFLLTVFELAATFFVCQGLYAAADLTDLLLANCGEEVRANRTLTTLLNKLYKVFIVVLGVMTMAQETGLPVGSIVASAGLVGLTISLAAQDSAKNLFSGLVILLDRPFSIGDWITVGDVSGEVVDINFRSTKVRALDNSVYILTNSTVSSATVNNGTLRNKRLYRFTLGAEALKHNMPLVALVRKWAKRKRVTPAQFALVWMLSRKAWIAPIPGTTNPAHLDDFLGAATVRLTPYEMEEFDKEYARIDLIGHRADPFTESQIDK